MDMKRFILLLACWLPAMGCHPAAKEPGATFYLQLVRGADSEAPPSDGSKPIGQKLRKRLQCVFKWKHYWEVKRDCILVPPGGTVTRRLAPDQTVELELLDPLKVAVRIYSRGQLVRRREQPAANAFCVTGARVGDDQSWFIVVRRDAPLDPDN